MSRGFGAMQRAILWLMVEAVRHEPQGPCEAYQYFHDAQGRDYHPAQVVRVGWLSAVIATAREEVGPWWTPSGPLSYAQDPSFKASFSRALRILTDQRHVLPVWISSLWVLRPVAEAPKEPQGRYWRRPADPLCRPES